MKNPCENGDFSIGYFVAIIGIFHTLFMISYWFLKTESTAYSWEDLLKDGKTSWTGVRNFQARNNLNAMKKGDRGVLYHSGDERVVVGTIEVIQEAYPDPTATEGEWVTVDIVPLTALTRPVTLELMKNDPDLQASITLKQSRLSVSPLTTKEYMKICKLGGITG